MSHSKPRVIVGLDFGTTYSGFAYADVTHPDKIHDLNYYRGCRLERPLYKTLTASYYKQVNGVWVFQTWGDLAREEYERNVTDLSRQQHGQASVGSYFTGFKLHLAGSHMGPSSAQPLPPGPTVDVLITDYLRAMGEWILEILQLEYGSQLSRKKIQWCITVPSIWDNAAKATMKTCMAAAGLVNGLKGSRHPLIVVLEPEAAFFRFHTEMEWPELEVGDMLLVADIGSGTADIVVQEVVPWQFKHEFRSWFGHRLKEVTISSGGLSGGTYLDMRFMEFLHTKIGPCLKECIIQEPRIYTWLIKCWEYHKVGFGDPYQVGASIDFELPMQLVSEWEKYDVRMGNALRDSYDDLEITYKEMQSIFDPMIDRNLELIDNQLQQAGGVKVLTVMGGFAGSEYLMGRIKRRFAGQVPHIFSLLDSSTDVCYGAVALALHLTAIHSRIFKETDGVKTVELFMHGLHLRKRWNIRVCGTLKSTSALEGNSDTGSSDQEISGSSDLEISGSSDQEISSELRTWDSQFAAGFSFTSKRLIGKGYVRDKKYSWSLAREDFVRVLSGTLQKEADFYVGLKGLEKVEKTSGRTVDNDTGSSGQGISSELQASDLPSKRLIGKGLASIVYETEWNGEMFARKDFVGVPSVTFRKEADKLVGLKDHENVLKTYGRTVDEMSCSLVLQYMEDNLLDFLRKKKESHGTADSTASGIRCEANPCPFQLAEALDIILQVARGMKSLHDQKIPHGDLKTRNILVSQVKGGDKSLLSVRVADFGLVRTKSKSVSFVSRQARKRDVVRWKAPEVLETLLSEDEDATSSESDSDPDTEGTGSPDVRDWLRADVYSFAVTCSQILTGEDPYPYGNWKELGSEIVSEKLRPNLPAACPRLSELLKWCWTESRDDRPTFSFIVKFLESLAKTLGMEPSLLAGNA